MKTYSIYGNCQAVALAKVLSTCDYFKKNYSFVRLKPVHRIAHDEYIDFSENIAPKLSFLLSQPVSDEYRGGGYGSESLKTSCDSFLYFPSIQFHGYFLGLKTIKFPSTIEFRDEFRANYGVSFTDIMHFDYILKAYLADSSVVKTAELFYCKKLFGKEEVQTFADNSLSYLHNKEQSLGLDFSLSSFISENLRERRLFHTYRHPNTILLTELATMVLSKLNIQDFSKERLLNKDPLSHISYPIQRSVEEHLDLQFSDFFLRINGMVLDVKEMVDFYYSIYSKFDKALLTKLLKAS